jgi:integrase
LNNHSGTPDFRGIKDDGADTPGAALETNATHRLSAHDQILLQELRRTDDLLANALLLTRATGIRIGECIDLAPDCVRQQGPEQWALQVPLGKLHTERLVPLDEGGRRLVTRLLALRPLAPLAHLAKSAGWLLLAAAGTACIV